METSGCGELTSHTGHPTPWLDSALPPQKYLNLPSMTPHLPCFCSGSQSSPTLRDPMDCSTPGLPVLHHLLEFA